ncbi:MAG: PilT/PilU family type 4a pilus ATPase [Proteobacteria bacterium]|nr:PilT/PilU family type 4a pilus ATPase [Pseudomonadota bacterium]
MDLDVFLGMMGERAASDLFFGVGAPPALKVDGALQMLDMPALDAAAVAGIAHAIMDDEQRLAFASGHEMNFTLHRQDLGRFRVNLYRQRQQIGIAIRYVPSRIPGIDELRLPESFKDLIMQPRGLILVVGGAGSGKTTTLAAMIDHRNHHHTGHILSIEDPIEYLHQHRRSLVDQREVGVDTTSYAEAMRNALRQAPDVIFIGEIRDRVTMEQAMVYAQTGQLCLATLHANNASQTIARILSFFPDEARQQVLLDLSLNLKAVISQRLLRTVRGGRRAPAVELLLQTPFVADLIRAGQIEQLADAMKQGLALGMLTFEESLVRLVDAGLVSWDEALANADSRSDLALRRRLNEPMAMAATVDGPQLAATAHADDSVGTWVDGGVHQRHKT